MLFQKIFKLKAFWKSVLVLGIGFVIVYNLFTMIIEFGGFDFSGFYDKKLADGKWIRLVLASVFSAFVYGLIIAYGKFYMKLKNSEN